MNNTKERDPCNLKLLSFPLTGPGQLISTSSPLQEKDRIFPLKNNFTRASSWPEANIYSDDMVNVFCVERVACSGEVFTRKPAGLRELLQCMHVCTGASGGLCSCR